MASWETFAVIAGAAAAALLGLLFVAISIRIDLIAGSTELRNRAAQTLVLLGTALLVSMMLALPGQSYRALGAEVLATALLAAAGLLALDRRARRESSDQRIAAILDMVTPSQVTSLLLVISGVLLTLNVSAGLYVLVAPVLVAISGSLASAWLVMTRATD